MNSAISNQYSSDALFIEILSNLKNNPSVPARFRYINHAYLKILIGVVEESRLLADPACPEAP